MLRVGTTKSTAILVGPEIRLEQGRTYRMSVKLKSPAPGASASLMLQSFSAGSYFWLSHPSRVLAGSDWVKCEAAVKIPAEGEEGFHAGARLFRMRVDFPPDTSSLLVAGASLREVSMLDEWASWQALGMDVHSVVADPMFADANAGDYGLRSGSPALKLGFRPIPVGLIGPYKDDLRATWPIVEARGARESASSPAADR
jgi:hypothetical protein